jgi:hypothetical protein
MRGPVRAVLQTGRVDARLLVMLAALAAGQRFSVTSFGSAGPGAGAGTPLRSVQVTAARATLTSMLAYVRAQRVPYQPAHASITSTGARSVLTIGFAAPSPAGLLGTQAAP